MKPVDELRIVAGQGVVGNKPQKRPVTLIAQERWAELMEQMGASLHRKIGLDPSTRRANVMLSGIDLIESTGKTIRIGDVELIVRGNTRPCHQMEAALPGLEEAMKARWGGGAWTEVVTGGTIRTGDDVSIA